MPFNPRYSQIDSRTPFQAPPEITVSDIESDPKLAKEVLTQAREDLEMMNTRVCKFEHHRAWETGKTADICSDFLRHTNLHCGHGGRLPLTGVVVTLARFEFLTPREGGILEEVAKGRELFRADQTTGLIEAILTYSTPDTVVEHYQEKATKAGIKVPVDELTPDNAEKEIIRLQAEAGKEVRILRQGLIKALQSAEDCAEAKGDVSDMRAAFREVFKPAYEKLVDHQV